MEPPIASGCGNGSGMEKNMTPFRIALALLALVWTGTAQARTVSGTYRGKIKKGVFQLGFDNFLLFRSDTTSPPDSDDSTAVSNLIWTGGITPRYFVINNLAVSAQLNFFIESQKTVTTIGSTETETETSDSGFLGIVMAHYYVHTTGGMFFKPGIGGGYLSATRSIPDPTDAAKKIESSISGIVGKLDLGLEYFATRQFSLRAGPEVLLRLGSETFEDDSEGPTSTRIDATFAVGFGYVF